MDITLERILSLIPRKPDGKYVHGAKKQFAESIGLKGGNLVSDWESGRVNSYRNYLYEISEKYNVSVEWLKGESDIKEKRPADKSGREVTDDDIKFALFGGEGVITDAMYEEVKRFAKMVKLREEAENKKE